MKTHRNIHIYLVVVTLWLISCNFTSIKYYYILLLYYTIAHTLIAYMHE